MSKYAVYTEGRLSGMLEELFDSFEEAQEAGQEWQRNSENNNPGDNLIYMFEIVEESV